MDGPPLKHDRDLNKFKDAYGIKSPEWSEGAELLKGLRQVVLTDDARHLVPPLPVPVGHWITFEGAGGVGVFSGASVQVLGRGAYVIALIATGSPRMSSVEPTNWTPGVAGVSPLIVDPEMPLTSIVTPGTATAIWNSQTRLTVQGAGYQGCPFFLSPGNVFWVMNAVSNAAETVEVVIQETR